MIMGETVRNPDFAASLRSMADAGPEDFYTGTMARRMLTDLEANGAYVTEDDFASYALHEDRIVRGDYRGYTIASAPSPHGGPTLIAMLNILEGYDLAAMGHNTPDYIYTVAMAMKAAFADRNPYMADPRFCEVPEAWMISKARAAYWREQIDAGTTHRG